MKDLVLKLKNSAQAGDKAPAFNSPEGEFLPFSYALGLEFDPKLLESGVSDGKGNFLDIPYQLNFRHESCHLLQFCSSILGLDAWRLGNHALRGWIDGAPWKLPITLNGGTQTKVAPFLRILEFSYIYSHEMLPDVEIGDFNDDQNKTGAFSIFSSPYNPLYFHMSGQNNTSEERSLANEFVADTHQLGKMDLKIIDHQFCLAQWRNRTYKIRMNAAVLFESSSVLSEIFVVFDMLSKSGNFDYDGIPADIIAAYFEEYPPIYWSAFHIFKNFYKIDSDSILLEFAAVVDVALMYTNLSGKDARAASLNSDKGWNFETVFSVFLRACEAARHVKSIAGSYCFDDEKDRQELQRFQDDITNFMGIPSIGTLTNSAFDQAEALLKKSLSVSEKNRPKNFVALELHVRGLGARLEVGAGAFLAPYLPEMQDQLFLLFKDRIEFYNIESKVVESPNIWHNEFAGIADLLSQTLNEEKLTCPFKEGRLYRCPGHNQGKNKLCTWRGESHTAQCPLRLLRELNSRSTKAISVLYETDGNVEIHGKVGRNASCPCGSSKKYKRCCGAK